MKNILFPCILLFAGSISYAQAPNTANEVATQLFKNVKSKLTAAEKNQVAAKLNFVLSGNKEQPFALDKDSKDYPFAVTVLPVDMNKDGREEVFIFYGNSFTSGNTGSSISLFIKNAAGVYADNLGFPGTLPDALSTPNTGYPDLLVGGPGFEYPVYRWNGKAYVVHRRVKDKDYGNLKKTSVEEISKTYQQGSKK